MKLTKLSKILLFLIFLGLISYVCFNIYSKKLEDKYNFEYNTCLNTPFDESNLSGELKNKISELDEYLKDEDVSVGYEDLTTGFTYSFNEDEVYYAASTIKILDALYIYTKAEENQIDLDETITYESKFVENSSKGMDQHQIGEKISIKKLVEYAIIYSDNTAHKMLINYIGFNNLKDFGNELGATNTLVGGDNFGNISLKDAMIYLKAVNNFITSNKILGEELKTFLIKAEENMIKYPELDVEVAHKYGHYLYYFHDLGIVYDKKPYVVAILTTYGQIDYQSKINNISQKINEFHQFYQNYIENMCKSNLS